MDETIEALVFGTGVERFAIATTFVHSLLTWSDATVVEPDAFGATRVALGANSAFPILDPVTVLGSGGRTRRPRHLLALGQSTIELALLSETPPRWERQPAPLDLPWSLPASDRALIRGLTPGGVVVIDGEALLADPRFGGAPSQPARDHDRGARAGA